MGKKNMSGIILDIVELLLTAEIYNRYSELDVNDLPKNIRKSYWNSVEKNSSQAHNSFICQNRKTIWDNRY